MLDVIINHMKDKTISFCITCCDLDYNLLDGLIKLLRNQTEPPDEVVISSSGITADKLHTGSIIIAGKEIPIINTNSEVRHSEGAARNAAAKVSSHELVQFFDVDDIPHNQRIEFTKKIFNTTKCDALVHGYKTGNHSNFAQHVYDSSLLFECYWKPDNGLGGGQLRANDECNIAHGPITVKKDVFDVVAYGKDPRAADCKFCGNLISNNKKVFYYHEELMYYTL